MRRRGYARLELLVVVTAIVALTAIAFLVVGQERRPTADASTLREIHQAMVLFAELASFIS